MSFPEQKNTLNRFFKPSEPSQSERDFLKKIKTTFKKNGKTHALIQRDAMIMHHFLSPSLTIYKKNGAIKEKFLTDLHGNELNNTLHPDVILIFGDHDFKQIEQVSKIYNALTTLGKPPRKIFITGIEGENSTYLNYLIQSGIPQNKIVAESKSANTGQDIELTDALMQKDNIPFSHILFSGTPVKILRQVRSYEMQSKYDWQRITTLPPTLEEIKQQYYSNSTESILNMMSALREIALYLDYTLNSNFMSARTAPAPGPLSESMQLLIDYYSILTKQDLNKTAIVNNFLAFCHSKAEGKSDDKLKIQLSDDIKLIAEYFRSEYQLLEEQQREQIEKKAAPSNMTTLPLKSGQ